MWSLLYLGVTLTSKPWKRSFVDALKPRRHYRHHSVESKTTSCTSTVRNVKFRCGKIWILRNSYSPSSILRLFERISGSTFTHCVIASANEELRHRHTSSRMLDLSKENTKHCYLNLGRIVVVQKDEGGFTPSSSSCSPWATLSLSQ